MKIFKMSLSIIFLSILVLAAIPVYGYGLNGGRGLMHIQSAWSLKPGYLTMYTHTRFFGKVGSIGPVENKSAVTYWDVQGSMTFNYGINEHVELSLTQNMYQDNHKSSPGFNFPDDMFFKAKLGSYGAKGSALSYGAVFNLRFPTASKHNLIFEPYSAGTVEFGMMGLLTYSRDPLYPEDAINVHLNLGYLNHNDVGQKFSNDGTEVTSMSQELLYGLGIKLPSTQFDFAAEIYGTLFIQQPPKTAFSIEDYVFFSPGISYKAYRWLAVEVAGDILLSSGENDETDLTLVHKPPEMPNYPSWRINIGFRMTLLPTTAYKVSEKDILMRKAENRRELFEQIIKEQRETESAEEELERIKAERRKAERELERLRRILEGEAQKNKNKKEDE